MEKPMDPIKTQLELNLQEAKQERDSALRKLAAEQQEQLDEERKTRQDLQTHLQSLMDKERQRLIDQHKEEIKHLKEEFLMDRSRAKDLLRTQPEFLKSQIAQ